MRIGVISDIHGNYVAMDAVMRAMGHVDMLWCLGDLVGYGPQPNECVARLRETVHRSLRGNHDLAALGLVPLNIFNREAAAAAEWTGQHLTAENRAFVESLPEQRVEMSKFTLVHGSPRDPVWEYLLDGRQAMANFPLFDTPLCLVGHSHIPLLFDETGKGGIVKGDFVLTHQSRRFTRLIVNPGSVGQPRDRNPKAAYMILTTFPLRLEWHRVAYDIPAVQRLFKEARLPNALAERLAVGV